MQTVLPHEDHFDSFILVRTQSPEIINFDIIRCPIIIAPTIGAIQIPHLFHIENMISLDSMLGRLPIKLALTSQKLGPLSSRRGFE